MKINCIIIDDEPLARKGLANYIMQLPNLELTGTYAGAVEAMEAIRNSPVELVFLDIQMPGLSGLEMLRSVPQMPVTIITSAFPNHALEGFELNVMDYLVKPIPFERFVKAVNKATDFIELKRKPGHESNHTEDYFFIKCEGRYEKILFDDLLFAEGLQNYVMLHTHTKRFMSYLTLKAVEEYLPADRFLKVQKSYIVSLSKIESIDGDEIIIAKKRIAISRTNRDEILNKILANKLLKR